jgi:hypothetical protein
MNIFTIIGVATTLICIICIGLLLVRLLIDGVDSFKRHYYIKHRFDKPPTAECYCIDCRFHGGDGQCSGLQGWRTADEWFCWKAEPKKK